jgi:hypothetical protein
LDLKGLLKFYTKIFRAAESPNVYGDSAFAENMLLENENYCKRIRKPSR